MVAALVGKLHKVKMQEIWSVYKICYALSTLYHFALHQAQGPNNCELDFHFLWYGHWVIFMVTTLDPFVKQPKVH
jgi:hypothetical protein